MRKKLVRMILLFLVLPNFIACSPSTAEIDETVNTRVAESINATLMAIPTEPIIPEPTSVPTSTPTESPVAPEPTLTPQIIEFDNPAVTISKYENATSGEMGKVRVQLLAGGIPIRDAEIEFYPATKDIVDQWTADTKNGVPIERILSDINGIVEASFPPGDYAMLNGDYDATWNQMIGSWGIQGFDANGHNREMIVFTVTPGTRTEILVSLAKLEIGIITSEGEAAKQLLVQTHCQGQDISGNIVPSDRCRYWPMKTDITGIATYNLGPGTYILEIPGKDIFYNNITVEAGESRQDIFEIP